MKKIKKGIIVSIAIITIAILGIGVLGYLISRQKQNINLSKIDDWEYKDSKSYEKNGYLSTITSTFESSSVTDSASISSSLKTNTSADSYLGYTVGGASNVDSFRQNIKNNYLPLSTDITYNGLYSEYYFDTGVSNIKSDEMFYPTYSCAVSTDPLSKEKEYYLSVGLNSNIKESDFSRPKINLVVALDISGSMSSSFNSYYYDNSDKSDNKSKMKIAEECLNNLIDKLNPDDRIGIILFDDGAYLGKKISLVSNTDTQALKNHILEIEARGGTNFSAGYKESTSLFEDYLEDESYQNRIIVITDAMPNLGATSSNGLMGMIEENAKNKIYTSLIGVGVDFNTELTEKISNVTGANYYSVHSSEEFNKTLAEEFDYMITPLIYDLNLSFKSDNFEIENVYGSDSVDKSTGNIMHINTLFPASSNSEGEVKGGIVVLKLKRKNESEKNDISLKISYKDTKEQNHSNEENVEFKNSEEDYYDNLGIQKAIVLARYVNIIKNWIMYERTINTEFLISSETGIKEFCYDDDYVKTVLGVNERKSTELIVNEKYKENFKLIKNYIEEENKKIDDKYLKNEIEVLEILIEK